jgi:serine/threonine-protein kinase
MLGGMQSASVSEPGELQVGDTLGPFALIGVLGEGGMGIVFKAVREPGGETVALKVLKKGLMQDETFRRRFVHEGRAAQEVRHKHLVPIVDAGEVGGRQYLAVAYVAGRSLNERIKEEGPLPVADVLDIIAGVGSGLDALHDSGLFHRDVKSANVLLDENGTAMLTDFGLAKGRAYTVLTKAGQVLGTLDYLAPELIRGEQATTASDIYALGCLVYECLTGVPPFAGKPMYELGVAILEEPPPDPSEVRPELPKALSWAALQALEKDPARRPTSATAYATMLRVAARETRA